MGQVVIAAYRPKPGQAQALLAVVREHVPILRQQGLATSRPVQVLRANDGTLLEIFEWVSQAAVEAAHSNPAVRVLWARFDEACSIATLATLPGSDKPFPHFEPIEM